VDEPAPSRWRDLADVLGERRGIVVGLAAAAAIVIALFLVDEEQAVVIGIITGAGYGLVALGLTLVYKSSGIFNFAQGEGTTEAVLAL
jgi:hypothetical protein